VITAGIDMGAKNIKAVVLKDGKTAGKSQVLGGFDTKESASTALNAALKEAGIARKDVEGLVATGIGKKEVYRTPPIDTGEQVSEVAAAARGAVALYPSARTVIDVGAEEGRVARFDEKGTVKDFAINERCAAGAGTFVEAMSRALEVKVEEMGPLSLKSEKSVPMNAQCAVFAESEVVSLIHAKTSKPDIARAIHDAIATRIASMVRRVGVEKDVVLIGGVARNAGFVNSLQRELGVDLIVLPDPEYVSALGAALIPLKK